MDSRDYEPLSFDDALLQVMHFVTDRGGYGKHWYAGIAGKRTVTIIICQPLTDDPRVDRRNSRGAPSSRKSRMERRRYGLLQRAASARVINEQAVP